MSQSPSADLYYGYDLGEMYDEHFESTAPQWWQDAEESDDYLAWESALADRLGESADTYPIQLSTYGYSEGDKVWALQVKASVQSVGDWRSIEVDPLVVAPEWNDQLAQFIELLELNVSGNPAWHLNCSYG
jgi:hypothetical protein